MFTIPFEQFIKGEPKNLICYQTNDTNYKDANDDLICTAHFLRKEDHMTNACRSRDHLCTNDCTPAVTHTDTHAYQNICGGIGQYDISEFFIF